MALTLTVDLTRISPAQAKLAAGFILQFADGSFEDEPVPSVTTNDPESVFGAIPQGSIASAGPSLVIPQTVNPTVLAPNPPSVSYSTLDSAGLPWDARIHASSKVTNKDGTWRTKRGVDNTTIDQVNKELRQVMAIPSPGPQLVPPAPAAPIAPPPPPASEAEIRQKYIDLFGRVSSAMAAGKFSEDQLAKCLASIGVPSLPLLGARLDLVPAACNLIDGVIAGASA